MGQSHGNRRTGAGGGLWQTSGVRCGWQAQGQMGLVLIDCGGDDARDSASPEQNGLTVQVGAGFGNRSAQQMGLIVVTGRPRTTWKSTTGRGRGDPAWG